MRYTSWTDGRYSVVFIMATEFRRGEYWKHQLGLTHCRSVTMTGRSWDERARGCRWNRGDLILVDQSDPEYAGKLAQLRYLINAPDTAMVRLM